MADLNLNNLKMDFKYIENSETAWNQGMMQSA